MEKFVIKTRSGAFVEQSTTSKQLNYVHKPLEDAQKYSTDEINHLRQRYQGSWTLEEFTVLKVLYSIEITNNKSKQS